MKLPPSNAECRSMLGQTVRLLRCITTERGVHFQEGEFLEVIGVKGRKFMLARPPRYGEGVSGVPYWWITAALGEQGQTGGASEHGN